MTTGGSTRETLELALNRAAAELAGDGIPPLEVARARNLEHGDYASAAGLQLARHLRRPPPQIAAELARKLGLVGDRARAEAVGGYVNFRLTLEWLQGLVGDVAARGGRYGQSELGGGEHVQVEFVSVNPTGPLHVGHGRGAILGDSLARILAFTGHRQESEYYVNDYGSQTVKFAQSVLARAKGEEPPTGGYVGGYVDELAAAARGAFPDLDQWPAEEAPARLQAWATEAALQRVRATLDRLRVHFDVWFSEASLWSGETAARALGRLGPQLQERDGARWFVTGGEDNAEAEDRVVIRRDGQPTYFASDLGYLLDRFENRGFERVIEVWGADHHGYVKRMKQGAAGLGLDPDQLIIILVQTVHLEGGRMSKREGRLVTLDELIDRVGVDAVRYFYLLRSPDAMMNFNLDLAVAESNENPVYYAQYAHARLAGVERLAAERGEPFKPDLSRLVEPWELDLAREIAYWPEAVEEAARLLQPHRVVYYINQLADRIHGFYQAGNRDWRHRVVVDDAALSGARLELCRAAKATLASALELIGVSAPERM